jgi:hypothetical protein
MQSSANPFQRTPSAYHLIDTIAPTTTLSSSASTRAQEQEPESIALEELQSQRYNTRPKRSSLPSLKIHLDDRYEMKFSHSLQFNSVPDWADKYLA